MRKRRLRLALLAVALMGVVAWLVWPTTTHPDIISAREKYARLTLGMSASDVAAILGVPPEQNDKFYGVWLDDNKWYTRTGSPGDRQPLPGERLYDWRTWTFGKGDSPGWPYHIHHIQVFFDDDRLVEAYFHEVRNNPIKQWLREVWPARLSRHPSFLKTVVAEGHKAIPPP